MDDFDVTALDGLVELVTLSGIHTLSVIQAEALGVALLRAAGVADMKATDDEAGTPLVVTADEPIPF